MSFLKKRLIAMQQNKNIVRNANTLKKYNLIKDVCIAQFEIKNGKVNWYHDAMLDDGWFSDHKTEEDMKIFDDMNIRKNDEIVLPAGTKVVECIPGAGGGGTCACEFNVKGHKLVLDLDLDVEPTDDPNVFNLTF